MSIFAHQDDVTPTVSPRLEIAIRNIQFVRRYTLSLLDGLSEDQWYWVPPTDSGYVTHIAWQCGHIAMAQYGLTLFRQRGRAEVDSSLMSGKFRKLFMRGTEPSADRQKYPPPEEIRAVMDRVYEQMLGEIASFDGSHLDQPVDQPHAAFATCYGALLFAGDHEMVHAGQIGMLRRLMGQTALR